MRIVWSRQAEGMLDEALDYLSAQNARAAHAILDELMVRVRALAQFPRSGRIVPELRRPEIRELLVGPYRVPYHCDAGQVTVLGVLHDRRLLDADLLDECHEDADEVAFTGVVASPALSSRAKY